MRSPLDLESVATERVYVPIEKLLHRPFMRHELLRENAFNEMEYGNIERDKKTLTVVLRGWGEMEYGCLERIICLTDSLWRRNTAFPPVPQR